MRENRVLGSFWFFVVEPPTEIMKFHLINHLPDEPCNCDGGDEQSTSSMGSEHLLLLETLRELNDYIRMRKRVITEEEDEEDMQADWRFMAMVIDRLSLYVSTIFGLLAMLLIVVATPHKNPVPNSH